MKRLDLRRILCPIDLSPRTDATLATASAVARARGAELRAFHVIPAQGPAAARRIGSQQHQRLMSRLRAKLADADLTYDRIGAAARLGDPATEILRFAREMPADLIVMGAPAADRPERPDGPVASVVVSRSDCSVLTLPAGHLSPASTNAGLFSRIVCGVDPVPSSASVMQQALSLAWETEGRITYVCVVPERTSASPAELREELFAAIPPEAKHWCTTDVVIARGVASDVIVKMAVELNAELVVIGAPRRSTSTTHAVISRARCPVLVTHDARPLPRPTLSIDRKKGSFDEERDRMRARSMRVGLRVVD